MQRHSLWTILIIGLGALGVIAVWMIASATPSSEAVRLRNSLLAEGGSQDDFEWRGSDWPADFKSESRTDVRLDEVIANLDVSTVATSADLQQAIVIAEHLASGPFRGGAIQSNTIDTYSLIVSRGGGYCGDFTQVFNALASSAGIAVREWGMSFDGFGGDGHAFNEIYDHNLQQWIMIDSFNSFYTVDPQTRKPLSVFQFRDRIANDDEQDDPQIVRTSKTAFGFRNDQALLEYFRRGQDQFYLWWGNNSLSYDANSLVAVGSTISRSVEQVLAIVAGVHPNIRIPVTSRNRNMVDELHTTKMQFLAMLVAAMAIGMVTMWAAFMLWSTKKKT